MTELRDPPRWTRASDAPAGFDELVGSDRMLAPDARAMRKLFAGVATELGRPELPAALERQLGVQPAAAGMTLTAKIVVGLAVVALAAGAAFRSLSASPRTALRSQPSRTVIRPEVHVPAPAPAPALTLPQPIAAGTKPPRPRPQRTAAPPSDEFTLLDRAQRALETDPAAALGLAERHRRQFAHGTFAQEREMVAIEALNHLGRLAAAQRRAATFLRVYPDSSHRVRLETMLRTAR